jgi:hypothetical protein
VLHLDVGVALAAVAHAEGVVGVVAAAGAGGGRPPGDRLQALGLDADVVEAEEAPAVVGAGHPDLRHDGLPVLDAAAYRAGA